MKGLNRIHDVSEERSMLRRKVLSILLALGFGGALLLSIMLVVFGSFFASALADWLGAPELDNLVGWLFWPASLFLVALAVALLYWLGPCLSRPFRWVTPGASVFAAGWLIASAVFGVYISNVGDFNRTYGTLAAFILALVWIYWSCLLALAGAQLNALLEKSDAGRAPAREPGGTRAQS
jgi:membrane protein